ncbi:MAG: CoA-binding protein [Planctomycetota bacterium]
MNEHEKIADFLAAGPWAVVGASTDREKYGNKVLRCYVQKGKVPVYPINPKAAEVEGLAAYPDLDSLPEPVRGISVITPPAVTAAVVETAAAAGIRRVWMQPGAESEAAVARAEALGMTVIAGGPCLLVVLGYRE